MNLCIAEINVTRKSKTAERGENAPSPCAHVQGGGGAGRE